MNFKIYLAIFLLSFAFGCEYYEHSNPYDPDYEGNLNDEFALADLKISSMQLYDDCPGVSLCYYGVRIIIENKGKSFMELPVNGILSTRDTKILIAESQAKFPYSTLQDRMFLRPNDKTESFFSIYKRNDLTLPYTVTFQLEMKDKYNFNWRDSIEVVIDF